jgi:hypothetical protein
LTTLETTIVLANPIQYCRNQLTITGHVFLTLELEIHSEDICNHLDVPDGLVDPGEYEYGCRIVLNGSMTLNSSFLLRVDGKSVNVVFKPGYVNIVCVHLSDIPRCGLLSY